jgi:hypothetical protein
MRYSTFLLVFSVFRPPLPQLYNFRATLHQPNIEGKFEPNLINSVVFLVSLLQQVRVKSKRPAQLALLIEYSALILDAFPLQSCRWLSMWSTTKVFLS